MHRLTPALLLFATGCGKLADLREKVEGLTETFVVQSLYVGVDNPDGLDLEAAGFDSGARVNAFLADASNWQAMDQAPITGAPVELWSDANGDLVVSPSGKGQYSLTAEEGLEYVPGEVVSLVTDYEGATHELSVDVPPSPEPDLAPVHSAGEALSIDLTGQGFDAALVVVLDMERMELVYTNEPKGINELYELTHPGGKLVGDGEEDEEPEVIVEIPAGAFAEEGVYAVGIAGMQVSDQDSFVDVNTALSTMMAGRFRFSTLCTDDYAELCPE